MEETYSSDNERKFEGHVDAVTSSITSPPSTPAPRKSKTQAERQREYRLRLKQKQLNNAEEKKNNEKHKREYQSNPQAERQREYRLRQKQKKLNNTEEKRNNQKHKRDYQPHYRLEKINKKAQNVRDPLWVDEGNLPKLVTVNSVDKHTEDVVQPCECQANVNANKTKQSPVKSIQTVLLVKLVPQPEQQKTQETEKSNVTLDIDDKYDVLGKYVASKLRQLHVEQRMYVERIIQEAIYEGQMGHLNINSQLVVDTETFVPSQSHDRERMRLEMTEIKVEKEDDPETRETEPDIEERSEDETESGSSFIGCVVRRERLKAAEEISKHLIDVANIKPEVTTGENYHLRGNLDTQYFNTNIQQSTVHESYCPDRAKRKKSHAGPYSETQTELEGFKLKTEINTEENWNPHETHLDKGSQFRTDIDLSKIKHETNDELG